MRGGELIPIGQLAARVGVSVSAIRFYESRGLLAPLRNAGGQRRFVRSDIRRLSFILIAQRLGLSIEEIKRELDKLPGNRAPTAADWQTISRSIQALLDERIAMMARLRDRLTSCIGCGCLSLSVCALHNPRDSAAARGTGPRYLFDDAGAGAITAIEAQRPRQTAPDRRD